MSCGAFMWHSEHQDSHCSRQVSHGAWVVAVHITQQASCACSIPSRFDWARIQHIAKLRLWSLETSRHCTLLRLRIVEIVKSGDYEVWRQRNPEIAKSQDLDMAKSGDWSGTTPRHSSFDHNQKKNERNMFLMTNWMCPHMYMCIHSLAAKKNVYRCAFQRSSNIVGHICTLFLFILLIW